MRTAERLSIQDVASFSGVTPTALRYYETIGLLENPPRVSGRRQYDPSVLDRLIVIKTARLAGFSLAEVRELLNGMSSGASAGDSWRALAARKQREVDDIIERLQAASALLQAVACCQCTDLAECAAMLHQSQ